MRDVVGMYVVDRDQPPLSAEQADVIRRFHEIYYSRWIDEGADTINASWFGHQALKCPLDMWVYQELIVRTRPDVVVEAGTFQGGSALYLAMVLDQLGHGRVITIDVEPRDARPQHPRITYLTGSSIDPAVVAAVRDAVGDVRAMVILDSDHTEAHVYGELLAYHTLVRPGDYLVVEDTNVNGHPALPAFGPGPMEAASRFLAEHDEFARDERCARFLMTLNPGGYLRRKPF
jgi:cephalosporin hydroxylase